MGAVALSLADLLGPESTFHQVITIYPALRKDLFKRNAQGEWELKKRWISTGK